MRYKIFAEGDALPVDILTPNVAMNSTIECKTMQIF